jgi:hypothetical protein
MESETSRDGEQRLRARQKAKKGLARYWTALGGNEKPRNEWQTACHGELAGSMPRRGENRKLGSGGGKASSEQCFGGSSAHGQNHAEFGRLALSKT